MFFWAGDTKADIGKKFGTKSNLQTTKLIDRAIEKAAEALRLYLTVGKVPTESGRLRRPKAAVCLPLPARRQGFRTGRRHVSREDLQRPYRTYVGLPHGRRG
jgi:hypothetical protein